MREYARITDDDIIKHVLDYMSKFPNAGRYQIMQHTIGNHTRLREIERKGLITLPAPQKRGHAWRKHFKIEPSKFSDSKGSIF